MEFKLINLARKFGVNKIEIIANLKSVQHRIINIWIYLFYTRALKLNGRSIK